ncbi:unnamed protein product [Orchesella dallaii]|uniref:Uncharacterized protein n=1 Tax=Orchesella dallaii TaxID=48710 RepID=A0ABP1RPB3_9HEXA
MGNQPSKVKERVGDQLAKVVLSVGYHRWIDRRCRQRLQSRAVGGEASAISYRALEEAVEQGSIFITRGHPAWLEQEPVIVERLEFVPTVCEDVADANALDEEVMYDRFE